MDERLFISPVYICHCGLNIGGVLDIDAIVTEARTFDGVHIARNIDFACSDAGQEEIRADIESGIDRVVVAACSPRMHQTTFERLLEDSGLNPYLRMMVNIREQVLMGTLGQHFACDPEGDRSGVHGRGRGKQTHPDLEADDPDQSGCARHRSRDRRHDRCAQSGG